MLDPTHTKKGLVMEYTLAEVVNRAIIVGETRRMATFIRADRPFTAVQVEWVQATARRAERNLERAIHEFARNNHTKPF